MSTPLFAEIRDEILETGPMTVARYMALCLGHPVHGYYTTRDPLGARGDFVTAPEISQMFGELIGLWIAATWTAMGAPAHLTLVELGPGRGTLMADALRALRQVAPTFRPDLHLVETSPVLRALQASRLSAASPMWHSAIDTLPEGPSVVVANEFFDALPVRQFQRTERGWCERLVGLSEDGHLVFGLAAEPDPAVVASAPAGAVMAVPALMLDLVRVLARRVVRERGALLAIDYGNVIPGFGDTLQAVAGHRFVDALAAPGEADLTTHVDFAGFARAAAGEGARVQGPVDQRHFLLALGLTTRVERLSGGATPVQAEAIRAAADRLLDRSGRGMGRLFKVMGVADPSLETLVGF